MALIRTPCAPTSRATRLVNISTPALAVAYAIDVLPGARPGDEAIVMTEPPPSAIMPGRNACTVRKVAVRLPSTTVCQSCSSISSSVPGPRSNPANAASTPTGPNSRSAARTRSATAALSVTSAATPVAVPPSSRIVSTTAWIASLSRPLTTTFMPLAAKCRQVRAPMPRDPPVTTATLPARSG